MGAATRLWHQPGHSHAILRGAPGGNGIALPGAAPPGEAGLGAHGMAPDRGQPARQILQPDTGGQEAVDRRACALETDGASHRQHHGHHASQGALMKWTRRNRHRELDEEIRGHIRMATEERVRQGEDRERARAAVLKEFGSVALAMEDTRSVWGAQWFEQLGFDLRYTARSLARNPGFALAAVLSLAIGIGATTALFSVLQHVAWRPLPYRRPEQLAIIWNLDPRLASPPSPASFPDWQDWRSQSKGFAGLAAFRNRPGFLQAGEESPQVE